MENHIIIPVEYLAWNNPWTIIDTFLDGCKDIIIVIDHGWDNVILRKKNSMDSLKYNIEYIDIRYNNNFKEDLINIINKKNYKIAIICNMKIINKI